MPKKHNIAYVKPDEPTFLRKLKEQIGYKEGPTVDTKREDLGPVEDGDLRDSDEEQPQIVVLRPGDLTADEAIQEKLKLQKEEEQKRADLTAPVVFKKPTKKSSEPPDSRSKRPLDKTETEEKAHKAKKLRNKSLLSFDEEDNSE